MQKNIKPLLLNKFCLQKLYIVWNILTKSSSDKANLVYGTGHVECFVEVEVVEIWDRRGWGLRAEHAGLGPEWILDNKIRN